jgi:hypothetical protein
MQEANKQINKGQLTNSVELRPSSETPSLSDTQEFPIFWNPKVHYPVHKTSILVPNPELDQFSPYHPILSL